MLNYSHNSLTWIKPVPGWFPLLAMIPVISPALCHPTLFFALQTQFLSSAHPPWTMIRDDVLERCQTESWGPKRCWSCHCQKAHLQKALQNLDDQSLPWSPNRHFLTEIPARWTPQNSPGVLLSWFGHLRCGSWKVCQSSINCCSSKPGWTDRTCFQG